MSYYRIVFFNVLQDRIHLRECDVEFVGLFPVLLFSTTQLRCESSETAGKHDDLDVLLMTPDPAHVSLFSSHHNTFLSGNTKMLELSSTFQEKPAASALSTSLKEILL